MGAIGSMFSKSRDGWPRNDREYARAHVGCNVTTCPNGKCRATGECIDAPRVTAPPLVPSPAGYTAVPINAGHGHVRPRPDGMKARCGGPRMCSVCARESAALVPNGGCACTSLDRADCREPNCGAVARPRTIVAFTGLAGAGKSTAAMHLVKRRGWQRVRFAGPLKDMMAALGLTPAEIDGSAKEMPCDLLGGKTPRWAMQTIGTEWGRNLIADDLWIRAWQAAIARVPAGVPVVVDDCRFPNEAAAIVAAGGIIVRIERPGAGTASVHESEQHALPAARILHNTLDERNLREQVDIFLADLSWADTAT